MDVKIPIVSHNPREGWGTGLPYGHHDQVSASQPLGFEAAETSRGA